MQKKKSLWLIIIIIIIIIVIIIFLKGTKIPIYSVVLKLFS